MLVFYTAVLEQRSKATEREKWKDGGSEEMEGAFEDTML